MDPNNPTPTTPPAGNDDAQPIAAPDVPVSAPTDNDMPSPSVQEPAAPTDSMGSASSEMPAAGSTFVPDAPSASNDAGMPPQADSTQAPTPQ